MGVLDVPGISLAQLHSTPRAIPMPPPSKVICRFASGHGWSGGADDLTFHLYGDRSYKGTTNGAGGSLYLASPTFTAQDWSASYLRIAVECDDPTKLNSLQVYVDSGTVGNAYIATVATAATAATTVRADWTFITIPRSAFTAPATPGWNNIVSVRIRFQDISTGGVACRVAAVELLPDKASTYPNGCLVLEADDGFAAQKTLLRPMLDALGVPCTLNPIIDRITGGSAGMTVADLQDMQDRSGWQISAHATTQTFHDSTTNTAAQAAVDFAANKSWLRSNGFNAGAEDLALSPGVGVWPTGTMRLAVGQYYRSARKFSGLWETVVPGDALSFRSLGFSGNTVAQLQSNIDAVAAPGGVFSFSFHDILTGSTNGTSAGLAAIAINNLQTVVQYALGKGMVARTRAEWLAGR